jgi:hypothetical protein
MLRSNFFEKKACCLTASLYTFSTRHAGYIAIDAEAPWALPCHAQTLPMLIIAAQLLQCCGQIL